MSSTNDQGLYPMTKEVACFDQQTEQDLSLIGSLLSDFIKGINDQ